MPELNMLMFGPLSFQKNSRLNLKLHRLGSDHNLVGGELDLVGGELELVGGELDQVQSKWGRTPPSRVEAFQKTVYLYIFCCVLCET